MDTTPAKAETYTAFLDHRRVTSGLLTAVALEVRRAILKEPNAAILIFSDTTGSAIDIDMRGTEDVLDHPSDSAPARTEIEEQRGRGRPKLGVVAREVTLLPRHWAWLNAQPGGASVSLRKLVDEARRKGNADDHIRRSREAAYNFMSVIAGNFPGFEEAARALFRGDRERFDVSVASWPLEIQNHAIGLGFPSTAVN